VGGFRGGEAAGRAGRRREVRWDDMTTCTCACTTSLRWRWCLVAVVTFDFEMGWVVVVKEVVLTVVYGV
jgi:hypothetical protein